MFAARIVRPGEVVVVPAEPVVIHPARNTRSTLKVLKRVVRGNQEFAISHPDLAINSTSTTSGGLKQQLRRPSTFLDAAIYAGFAVVWGRGTGSREDRGEDEDERPVGSGARWRMHVMTPFVGEVS